MSSARLIKTIPLFVAATGFSHTILAAPPDRLWASHIGGASDERLESVCFDPDGSLWIAGNTLSTGLIGGMNPTNISTDRDKTQQAGFIAHLTGDGSSIKALARFSHGGVYLTDVAADMDYIYAAGYATADFRPQLSPNAYDRTDLTDARVWEMASDKTGAWKSNIYRSIVMRMDKKLTRVLDATFLGEIHPDHPSWGIGDFWDPSWTGRVADPIGNGGAGCGMWRYVRGQNLIRFFANGDLLVAADCGLSWSAGVDAVYRFRRDDFSSPVWKTVVNPVGNNSDRIDGAYATKVCGFTRINGISIVPGKEDIYISGTGNGDTGFEPYYSAFVFKYNSAGKQLWKRDDVAGGGPFGAFDRIQTEVRPNQADSLGEGIAAAPDGRAFVAMWSDGGNSWLMHDPWTFGKLERQDGDSFSSFDGRVQVSCNGILQADGKSGWTRSNRLKPYTYDKATKRYTNVIYDIAPVDGGKGTTAYLAGSSHNALAIHPWDDTTACGFKRLGFLAKFDFADGGTTREFATHFPDVCELRHIATAPGGHRFATVGYSFGDNAPVPSGFQRKSAGGEDGYIVVFEDAKQAAIHAPPKTHLVSVPTCQYSPADPAKLTPADPKWEAGYQERVAVMVNAQKWNVGGGNAGQDDGKWSWSSLLAEMWKTRNDDAALNGWIKGSGAVLIKSPYAGSFYKAFSCPGYCDYYFRFKNHRPAVSIPPAQIKDAMDMIGHDASGNPGGENLRKGWAYMARADHHMDPLYPLTEFNSENFHWMERLASVRWAWELPDIDLGKTHDGRQLGKSRAWATKWMDNWTRAFFGAGRVEWNSNNYWSYTFNPISSILDCPPGKLPVPGLTPAQQAVLSNKIKLQARAGADWMVLENALHYVDGFRGGPDTRAKSESQSAFHGDTWSWMYAHFAGDLGSPMHPTFDRAAVLAKMPRTSAGFIAWASYRPLQTLIDIAQRKFSMPVEIQSAKPHYSLDHDAYAAWNGTKPWNAHPSMTRYGARFEFETIFLDENCLLASAATFRPDGATKINGQNELFSEQNLWRIMAKGTNNGAIQVAGNTLADPGSCTIAGRDPWENIGQNGNVMVLAVKRNDSMNGEFMVIPKQAVREWDGDRLFCDLGHGVYFAVLPISSGKTDKADSSHSATHQRYQWTFAKGEFGALVVELGVARDHKTFAAFKSSVSAKLASRLTMTAGDTVQYVSTKEETTRLTWQKPWTQQAGEPSYKLADGSIWGDSGGEAAGVVPRIWRNEQENDYATWDAYKVVRGEEIVRQKWGGDRLRVMANGRGVEIRVDPTTAEVSYFSAVEQNPDL